MQKILVPIDGSDNSVRACREALRMAGGNPAEVHLVNVQPPVLSGYAARFLNETQIRDYYESEGRNALRAVEPLPQADGVTYVQRIEVGHPADTLAAYAKRRQCDRIVMGTRGLGSLSAALLGSVATKVIHLAEVPVTLVK
ncbi:universal stress protein [Pigmentiphaga soli]|uniref:Universal stress protein n=1 Tax=Pigmentiphaga soli TaxID=1007095 RepID=A0ABP8GW94_9BURK